MIDASRETPREKRILHARRLRRDMTMPERRLWRRLRELGIGGSHFQRQAPVGAYFADFACHEARLIIEVDGETHASASAGRPDGTRKQYLGANGYRILRSSNRDVMRNIDGVLEAIHCAIGDREGPPPLTPPHAARGRGT